MIYVVDFEFCNLASIEKYFSDRKLEFVYLDKTHKLNLNHDSILMPGVGAFKEGISFLVNLGLDKIIREFSLDGGRVIGICLGMQLFLSSSEESPGVAGLGIVNGDVKKLDSRKERVPRIGWDEIIINSKSQDELLKNIEQTKEFYFVHSFYCDLANTNEATSFFYHGDMKCCASYRYKNIYGFQFHPEKSWKVGYQLLDNIFKPYEKKNNPINFN